MRCPFSFRTVQEAFFFIIVNVATIDVTLLEHKLFGWILPCVVSRLCGRAGEGGHRVHCPVPEFTFTFDLTFCLRCSAHHFH